MGLDMYLYAEKYISNVSESMAEKFPEYRTERKVYQEFNSLIGGSLPTPEYGGINIAKCVGYWRKANAIHGWIIREVANNVDECQRIDLDRTDLIRLRDECVNALADRANATPAVDTTKTIKEGEGIDVAKAIMNEMLAQRKNTNTLTVDEPLSPISGFFFGSTEKDEWYYNALEYTVETINSLLANGDEWQYYYRASW